MTTQDVGGILEEEYSKFCGGASVIRPSLLLVIIGLVLSGQALPSLAAQTQPFPESVFFEPDNTSPVLAKPGDLVTFVVQGVSMHVAPELEVRVPHGLSIARRSSCTAFALLDPQFSGNQRATQSDLYCSTSVATQGAFAAIRATPIDTTQAVLSYNVFLTISVRVPSAATSGLLYSLEAPTAGLRLTSESLHIEVVNPDGTRSAQTMTPTPPAIVRLEPPEFDTGLMFFQSVEETVPGGTVSFDLTLSRSATWELDSYALLVYAQDSTVTNVGSEFVDPSGDQACSQGTEGDPIPPVRRSVSDFVTNPIPSAIDVEVGSNAAPGSSLLVCVELVGFDVAGAELFSWNVAAMIAVG